MDVTEASRKRWNLERKPAVAEGTVNQHRVALGYDAFYADPR